MKNYCNRLRRAFFMLMGAGLFALNLGVNAGDIVTYVQTDTLGNPVTKTDSTGAVIWRQSYTPYGQTYLHADPAGPGFTGHRNDPATGLVYMQARYYDPKIGRFLSVDPVQYSDGGSQHFNLYWYANGNPMRYTDPDGRCPDTDFGCGALVTDRYLEQQVTPNFIPPGGNETVAEIAGRVNGETRGMKDSKSENEPLTNAREKIAHMRLNGISKWGAKVQNHASLTSPKMRGPDYKASLKAVETAVKESFKGIDPTHGATHYNMRTPSQAKAGHRFMGKYPVHTVSGPYKSPTKYNYIVTYGQPKS